MNTTPDAIANEASKPGVFSLIERLQNRNYPTEDVSIYLAEDAAYTKMVLEAEAADIRIAGTPDEKAAAEAKLSALEERIAQAKQAILDSEVIITVRSISSERQEELDKQSAESFPRKYEKNVNPLIGKTIIDEIPSADRDELFQNLLMGECIVKARFGDDIDDNINAEWWVQFQKVAPVDAVRTLIQKVLKMRMVTEWMNEVHNEDFSPRS